MGLTPETGANILVEPWLITENDFNWIYEVSKRRYGDRYDYVTTEGWFRNIVLRQPVIFLPIRMPHAFCVSMLAMTPWLPTEIECNVVFICAEEGCMWEAMKCLRSSIEWGRKRGCKVWRLSSDTDYDLRGMAKRLGAEELSPRFVLRY